MMRRLPILLLSVNFVLAALLAWLWIAPDGSLRDVHWHPPVAIRPDLGSLSTAVAQQEDSDLSTFMAILDRPLFSSSRRPPPPPPAPKVVVPVPPDPLNTLHLYGVFSGAGSGGVIARVDGKTRRVKVSEKIGEWSLKEVRPGAVIFSKGAETRTVLLVQARQGGGTAAAPAGLVAPLPTTAAPPPAAANPAAPPPAQTPAASPKPSPPPAAGANPFVIGGSR
jgi:hypothetical protein